MSASPPIPDSGRRERDVRQGSQADIMPPAGVSAEAPVVFVAPHGARFYCEAGTARHEPCCSENTHLAGRLVCAVAGRIPDRRALDYPACYCCDDCRARPSLF